MRNLASRIRRAAPWTWFAAANAVAITAYFLLPGDVLPKAVFVAIGLASGITILRRARTTSGPRVWVAFGATQIAWATGDAIWAAYEITGGPAPYPSFADVLYLAGYPLMMYGVVAHTLRQVGDDARKVLVDAGMIALVLAIGGWELVVRPYVAQAHLTPGEDFVGFLYPAMDLALASVSLILLHGSGARSAS
ncbi:MAG TPA: hypothetical protein VEV43_14965, partial [Actinomycetota bacterium]|nr:hypothetical protein [Actinomycetota bacterium]